MTSDKNNLNYYLDIEPEIIRVGQYKKSWYGLKFSGTQDIKFEREMMPWSINNDLNEILILLKNKLELQGGGDQLINISLPVSQAIIKTVEVPILDPKDIREAINFHTFWENLIQLPGVIEDYSIAYEIVGKNKNTGVSTLFVLIIKREILTHINDVSKHNGFTVNLIEPRFISLLKIYYEEKKIKRKKDFILVEIGPVENYLIIISNNIPIVINLFLSQQDKLNLQNGLSDRDYNQKLTKKYVSQIEQAIIAKKDVLKDSKLSDIFIYSKHNNSFNFEEEFKSQMLSYSVEFINPDNCFISSKNFEFQDYKGSDIIYGMSRKNKKGDKSQRWINNFNMQRLYTKKHLNINKEPIYSKLKILSACVILLFFYFWNQNIDHELKKFENKLGELIDKKKYYLNIKHKYEKLLQEENIIKKKKEVYSYFNDNQSELLSFQKIINTSVSQGIWFKSEIFENKSGFLVAGIALSDKGIIEFIEALRETDVFNLVNIEEIKVIENRERSNFKLREFKIRIKI